MKSNAPPILLTILLALVSFAFSENKKIDCQKIIQIGTRYTEWFNSSALDSLINCIDNPVYKIEELAKFKKKVQNQLGEEKRILNEQYGIEPFQYYYIRYSRFEKSDRPVKTVFTFDDKERIFQFAVQSLPKEAPTRFLNYQTKTRLQLPFKGEWFVAWGGRNINENQHAVSKTQRFAYDFVKREGCKTFDATGKTNSDYFCYNQEIIAPGAGKIVDVLNYVGENSPGQMPEIHGNRVIINHGNGEYSVLSHFKMGSIVVKVNDNVDAGQFLGLCGNSGHSSEPHLHYHLQNTFDIDAGEGLPIKFQSYLSDGDFVKMGEPKINERVENYE